MITREAAPAWLRLAYRYVRLRVQAVRLMRAAAPARTPAQWLEAVRRFPTFLAIQKTAEIVALLEIERDLRPLAVCEIGSALGGTTFLLTRAAAPEATVVCIDQAFDAARTAALTRFAGPGQRVVCLRGDSTDPKVRSGLTHTLAGRPLDFLLIDGDHRYEGVAADFASYAPLVRPGGVVALHDILPDHGTATGNWAGGVPRFWDEVRQRYGRAARELIADRTQDGYGIGVLTWPG